MLIHGADLQDPVRAALGYRSALDVLFDGRGWTVRCTPLRRVSVITLDGWTVFRKLHERSGRAALREWRALHQLQALGIRTGKPLCVAVSGRSGAVVTAAVAGRPITAWLREVQADPRKLTQWADFLCQKVAPQIARLHGAGYVYRDLYWNHIYATGCGAEDQVAWIDCERLFRPWFRLRRWIVKDLAGLLASVPPEVRFPVRQELRFLAATRSAMTLAPAIATKAQRIRTHVPKYG